MLLWSNETKFNLLAYRQDKKNAAHYTEHKMLWGALLRFIVEYDPSCFTKTESYISHRGNDEGEATRSNKPGKYKEQEKL